MKEKSFWQRMGLHDWFLKKEEGDSVTTAAITPNQVYHYIIEQFRQSVAELSFANRIVFYHEYLIAFNPDDYQEFMNQKKGIFGLIVQDCIQEFYNILNEYRGKGKTVEPSSSKWVFRFVSHPEYNRGDKSFMGKLLPGQSQANDNLRITFIPRQTGIAQTADVSPEILKGFNFYSEGYYEVPFRSDLVHSGDGAKTPQSQSFARLEAIIPEKEFAGRKIEFLMHDEEITVAGKDETQVRNSLFRVPSDWVNTPHLRIRFHRNENKLYVDSFGDKTVLNEKEVSASTEAAPKWVELPMNSKLVLNGIVGINVFKS